MLIVLSISAVSVIILARILTSDFRIITAGFTVIHFLVPASIDTVAVAIGSTSSLAIRSAVGVAGTVVLAISLSRNTVASASIKCGFTLGAVGFEVRVTGSNAGLKCVVAQVPFGANTVGVGKGKAKESE